MSRSLHTDPYPVRAARRVSAPYRRRSSEPRVMRRRARLGKTLDPSDWGAAGLAGESTCVDVRVCRARPGFVHPAGAKDIRGVLDVFGTRMAYGLRSVELRHAVRDDQTRLVLATLRVPGMIVLYEQPQPPWTIPGRLATCSLQILRRAGARVHGAAATTRIDWPGDTLRDFMLFDGLVHEVGHHIVQNEVGQRASRVMRTADHERRADAFATACRLAWTADRACR